MSTQDENFKHSIATWCASLGADPLFVQGAGGNVSWKSEDTLWVKASGTWLAEALQKDIFVPVHLGHLRQSIAQGAFDVTPQVQGTHSLRPSIETILHGLMQERVVVHLHAIEILSYLVRKDWRQEITARLQADKEGAKIRWVGVDYHKPGAPLAQAVHNALQQAGKDPVSVIFLQNHGVVIGGRDIEEAERILKTISALLATPPVYKSATHNVTVGDGVLPQKKDALRAQEYLPIADPLLHHFAFEEDLFERLKTSWAICPDHVVFLGEHAQTYQGLEDFKLQLREKELPPLVFIKGVGVFTQRRFNTAACLQLRCYYDVVVRQKPHQILNVLSRAEIGELLNWDAERYRQGISK